MGRRGSESSINPAKGRITKAVMVYNDNTTPISVWVALYSCCMYRGSTGRMVKKAKKSRKFPANTSKKFRLKSLSFAILSKSLLD